MKVIVQYEGNEEETVFVDFEKLLVGLDNLLKRHFAQVSHHVSIQGEVFLCSNKKVEVKDEIADA